MFNAKNKNVQSDAKVWNFLKQNKINEVFLPTDYMDLTEPSSSGD